LNARLTDVELVPNEHGSARDPETERVITDKTGVNDAKDELQVGTNAETVTDENSRYKGVAKTLSKPKPAKMSQATLSKNDSGDEHDAYDESEDKDDDDEGDDETDEADDGECDEEGSKRRR